MNICFFAPIFPPKFSGATLQALTLANALREKGYSIFFVTLTDKSSICDTDVFDGFPVYYVHVAKHNEIVEGTCSDLDYVKLIIKIAVLLYKLRNRFSIIHLHILGHPYMFLSLMGTILGKKTVAKVTMSQEIDFKYIGRIQGKFNKICARRFDRLIAISSLIMRDMKSSDLDQKKIEFIPNSVDTDKFHPVSDGRKRALKKQLGIEADHIISFVGGITYRKGVHTLIRLWPEIIKRFPDSVLLLIGPKSDNEGALGDEFCYEVIREDIAKYNIEENVVFTGKVGNVNEYLQISDLFVFPSKLEGMPNVLLESMACGVPAVSYRVSGADDIITDGVDGYVIECADSVSFEKAVIDLLDDDTKRELFSQQAHKKIMDKFSDREIVKRYIQLYTSLMT